MAEEEKGKEQREHIDRTDAFCPPASAMEWPSCMFCKHDRPIRSLAEGPPRCAAFPDGIPDEILDGTIHHTVPVPGDHGIQFTPKDGIKVPDYIYDGT